LEFKTTSYSDNSAATELIILAVAEVGKDNNIAYSGDIEFTGVGICVEAWIFNSKVKYLLVK